MTINSRNKGKVGEREWAEQLRPLLGFVVCASGGHPHTSNHFPR